MDSSILAIYQKEPLLAFSVITRMQVRALRDVSEEVFRLLDEDLKTRGRVEGDGLNRVYTQTWLWVLGAYEVLRTMAQAQGCFSAEVTHRVAEEKKKMARLRMPLSKQEYAGRKAPSGLEGMFSIVDTQLKDVGFVVSGERFSVRETMTRFNELIASITLSDILARHDSTYGV